MTRALIVLAVEPVGPARIAAGPRKVIVELAIPDRDLGPGLKVRAPPHEFPRSPFTPPNLPAESGISVPRVAPGSVGKKQRWKPIPAL